MHVPSLDATTDNDTRPRPYIRALERNDYDILIDWSLPYDELMKLQPGWELGCIVAHVLLNAASKALREFYFETHGEVAPFQSLEELLDRKSKASAELKAIIRRDYINCFNFEEKSCIIACWEELEMERNLHLPADQRPAYRDKITAQELAEAALYFSSFRLTPEEFPVYTAKICNQIVFQEGIPEDSNATVENN